MSKVVRCSWPTTFGEGLPRRDRQGCEYEAYVPDPLAGRAFRLDGDVAADVADAERAIAGLNGPRRCSSTPKPSPDCSCAPSRSPRPSSKDWSSVVVACFAPKQRQPRVSATLMSPPRKSLGTSGR